MEGSLSDIANGPRRGRLAFQLGPAVADGVSSGQAERVAAVAVGRAAQLIELMAGVSLSSSWLVS